MELEEIYTHVKLNPQSAMRLLIEEIEGVGDLELNDPTSPFVMLLEANISSNNAMQQETISSIRGLFPELALEHKDLYNHMTSEEELGSFAIPSKTHVIVMANVNDIKNVGDYDSDNYTYTVVIPKYTEINVSDITLSIQNDIKILLYENNTVFVEEIVGDEEDTYTDGNLPSVISKDIENADWVTFELPVKQLKRDYFEFNVTAKTKFDILLDIEDQYAYSNAYIKIPSGGYIPINTTNSTSVYNHSELTLRVTPLTNQVRFTIPTFYLLDLTNSFVLVIEVFTTKGDMLVPLDRFTPNDFTVKTSVNYNRVESAGVDKVNFIVYSKKILDGGANMKSFEDLRNDVIFNSTGMRDLPLTEHSLKAFASNRGFTVSLIEDVITSRAFIATRDVVSSYDNNDVLSYIDMFHGVANIYQPDVNQDSIVFKGDEVLIKSSSIFKNLNGQITPITQQEKDLMINSNFTNKSMMLKSAEYYCTPFYYILNKVDDMVETKVYDLDVPSIDMMEIVGKNTLLSGYSVNINRYGIFKIATGYELYFTLFGNSKFNDINKNNVYIQLSFDVGSAKIYFIAEYDDITDNYKVTIETDYFIDERDYLNVLNGLSDIYTNRIPINSKVEAIIYIEDSSVAQNTEYAPTLEVYKFTDTTNALCKERFDCKLGTRLDTIWQNSFIAYNNLRYEVANDDVYLTYKDNVFAGDVVLENGVVVKTTNKNTYVTKLLHRKGEKVLTPQGEYVYKYRKGEYILDDNGNPIPAGSIGYTYYTDLFLMQYEYKLTKSETCETYVNTVINFIRNWLEDDLIYLNSKLLEHSLMYFKPNRTMSDVKTFTNICRHLVKPRVKLYIDRNLYVNNTVEQERSVIGKIIHKHISKRTFKLLDIKNDIKKALGNGLLGIDIFDIGLDSADIITYKSEDNMFGISKVMNKTGNIEYDISITTVEAV